LPIILSYGAPGHIQCVSTIVSYLMGHLATFRCEQCAKAVGFGATMPTRLMWQAAGL